MVSFFWKKGYYYNSKFYNFDKELTFYSLYRKHKNLNINFISQILCRMEINSLQYPSDNSNNNNPSISNNIHFKHWIYSQSSKQINQIIKENENLTEISHHRNIYSDIKPIRLVFNQSIYSISKLLYFNSGALLLRYILNLYLIITYPTLINLTVIQISSLIIFYLLRTYKGLSLYVNRPLKRRSRGRTYSSAKKKNKNVHFILSKWKLL